MTAAIETIAELGYTKASFAKIAERAGLSSTGLISYHFASRRELMAQIVEEVYGEIRSFLSERMRGQVSVAGALRAYIEGNVEFAFTHRTQMQALLGILLSGELGWGEQDEREVTSPIEELLRQGQASGEFRAFDPRIMAMSIQRSVEGPTMLLAGDVELDKAAYAHELVTLYDLATRA
ncbi:TetR/AcrR family transcriptional regulator [Microbispora bryophytorum]|uniref:TetR/AcrR family transcriptional regulator n=1 Tax=Microbispora bryophytorum TaxID=1460882 RepID=UPI0033E31679